MNPDPALLSDPTFVLLAWAGGVALAASLVTAGSVVGPGFSWLAAGTAALIGVWPAIALGGLAPWLGFVAAIAGGVLASVNRPSAALALGVAALSFGVVAGGRAGAVPTVTALLALGGVTGEMLMGHWYLVDPTLPRRVLRALAVAGVVGVLADALVIGWLVGIPAGGLASVVYWVLVATTAVLMLAVLGALRHPAYSGVMAATGLSYLAVLTGLATVFFGRSLGSGAVPLGF